MDVSDIEAWVAANLPETILFIGGLLAIVITIAYLKDKESLSYKFTVFLGLVFGIIMAMQSVSNYGNWETVTLTLIAVAAFTLIIRPFREVHFSVIIALFVMVLIYIWLGGMTTVGDFDISFLAENPVRIIVSFVCGAIVYGLLNFAEEIVKLFGKILNWWPLLFLLGCVLVFEAILMFTGNGTILDYLDLDEVSKL